MFWPQHDLLTQEIKKKLYRLTLVGATTLVFSLAPGPTPKYPDSRKPLQQNPLALDRRSPFSQTIGLSVKLATLTPTHP